MFLSRGPRAGLCALLVEARPRRCDAPEIRAHSDWSSTHVQRQPERSMETSNSRRPPVCHRRGLCTTSKRTDERDRPCSPPTAPKPTRPSHNCDTEVKNAHPFFLFSSTSLDLHRGFCRYFALRQKLCRCCWDRHTAPFTFREPSMAVSNARSPSALSVVPLRREGLLPSHASPSATHGDSKDGTHLSHPSAYQGRDLPRDGS